MCLFTGGSNNSLNSSQIVRQGLRAVVSGRTQQSNVGNVGNNNNANSTIRRNIASPLDPMGTSSGALIDINNPNNNLMINPQQQQQLPGNMMSTSSDLDSSMRFNFDMPQGKKDDNSVNPYQKKYAYERNFFRVVNDKKILERN
jgi:hypothetical protein